MRELNEQELKVIHEIYQFTFYIMGEHCTLKNIPEGKLIEDHLRIVLRLCEIVDNGHYIVATQKLLVRKKNRHNKKKRTNAVR